MTKRRPPDLRRGDVIKTHPRDGFWGCAVVLSDPMPIGNSKPHCHIGITSLVLTHDYEFRELQGQDLAVLTFERGVRVGPGTYATRREVCIAMHTTKVHPLLPVIGNIDPVRVHPAELSWEVGDGTAGKYPLAGPITPTLGSEAVISWLRIHDPVRWEAIVSAARLRTEDLFVKIAAEERAKRRARRSRRGGT